jgi:hypothetical protein
LISLYSTRIPVPPGCRGRRSLLDGQQERWGYSPVFHNDPLAA